VEKIEDNLLAVLGGLAVMGIVLPIPIGLAVRVFIWLKDGYWLEIPFSWLGLPHPKVDWIGVQKVIDYYYSSPIELVISGSVLAIVLLYAFVSNSEQSAK
jgi:hypothetical protein